MGLPAKQLVLDRRLDYVRTNSFDRDLQTHVDFDIEVEKQLSFLGYTPATINRTRKQIRELLLYKNLKPIKKSTLIPQISQMSKDFIHSKPYLKLIKARDNNNLHLYKPGEPLYHLFKDLYP